MIQGNPGYDSGLSPGGAHGQERGGPFGALSPSPHQALAACSSPTPPAPDWGPSCRRKGWYPMEKRDQKFRDVLVSPWGS